MLLICSFLSTMMASSSFNNPSAVDNLKVHVFGIPTSSDIRPTLLECLLMYEQYHYIATMYVCVCAP